MSANSGGKITSSLAWSFSGRISAQLVSTIVGIILARLLDVSNYGEISIVLIFITLCDVFVTAGFGSAVIQKKEADSADFNTAFWLSLAMACVLYAVLFIAAPFIASYYEIESLSIVLRVMGLRLIATSINGIQQSYMRRQMQFKKYFLSTFIGTVLSGVIGVYAAYAGAGVWALVIQYMTNAFANTVILCFVSEWKPALIFSLHKAKEIFSFGWKVLATNLVPTLESNVRSLVVGKVFGATDLAVYDQGMKYPALLVTNINASLTSVMLPVFSRVQDEKAQLKALLRKTVRLGMFILLPILFGFAMVADTFVPLILTEKWIPAVPYIRIFCLVFLLRPFETACNQAVLAIGRSDISLKAMIAINVTALATVVIATFAFESVFLIAVGALVATLVSVMYFAFAVRKHLDYRFREMFLDIIKTFISGTVMAVIVYAIGFLDLNLWLLLALQIVAGAIIYIGMSIAVKSEAFVILLPQIKERLGMKK